MTPRFFAVVNLDQGRPSFLLLELTPKNVKDPQATNTAERF